MGPKKTDSDEITIIYDGSCPMCSAYVRYSRLREMLEIKLIDARQEPDMLRELARYGLDLEEGMVVLLGGRRFHGADAMHLLATLITRSGTWNRLSRWLFSSPRRSALFYPVLKQGRRVLLWLLRRPPLQI